MPGIFQDKRKVFQALKLAKHYNSKEREYLGIIRSATAAKYERLDVFVIEVSNASTKISKAINILRTCIRPIFPSESLSRDVLGILNQGYHCTLSLKHLFVFVLLALVKGLKSFAPLCIKTAVVT